MSLIGSGLQTALAFLSALLLLILVHEWGHYWVARRVGVKVLRFSIGFGKPIWLSRRGLDQTEWAIGAFPLGGYVRMLDEREGPVLPEEASRAFNRQSLPHRFAIVVAGPLANFILAVVIYWALYLYGIPGLIPYVDAPPAGTPAASAGFRAGERITQVGNQPVETWNEVQLLLIDQALERGRLEIETRDDAGYIALHGLDLSQLEAAQRGADLLDQIGLRPWDFPIPPEAGRILPEGPADRAGLQTGDRILAIDGHPLASWQALVRIVRASAGHPLALTFERHGEPRLITVTPQAERGERGEAVGKIGVSPNLSPELGARYWTTVREGPVGALEHAGSKTWEVIRLTFKTFAAMLVGEASWKNVGGPIQIADYAGQTARMGIVSYLTFIALISISLGALNLLPVPLLDGGHLMYYVVELIKGSPVSDRTLALTQRVGLILLTALMGFALYNDIQRLLTN